MKYKYYLSAIQYNRDNHKSFMENCDLHIENVGINVKISFVTDKEPMKRNIDKIIQVFENTRNNENLSTYYTDVELIKVERAKENKNITRDSNSMSKFDDCR